jgi:hypothetical protein
LGAVSAAKVDVVTEAKVANRHAVRIAIRPHGREVVWAKLQALVDGARIASTRLWG